MNTPKKLAEEIGIRLKRTRLNANMTQNELASASGITRKAVMAGEKGRATLEVIAAMMIGLQIDDQIDLFLPPQPISPIQLSKLRGKERRRASGVSGKPEMTKLDDEDSW